VNRRRGRSTRARFVGAIRRTAARPDAATGRRVWEKDHRHRPQHSYTITGAARRRQRGDHGNGGAEYGVPRLCHAMTPKRGKSGVAWFVVQAIGQVALKTIHGRCRQTGITAANTGVNGGGGTAGTASLRSRPSHGLYRPATARRETATCADGRAATLSIFGSMSRWLRYRKFLGQLPGTRPAKLGYSHQPDASWPTSRSTARAQGSRTPRRGFFSTHRTHGENPLGEELVDVNWATATTPTVGRSRCRSPLDGPILRPIPARTARTKTGIDVLQSFWARLFGPRAERAASMTGQGRIGPHTANKGR